MMNNEKILLIKRPTDTLLEQTKSKPHRTLEFKMNKQIQTFSFIPLKNLYEEDEWLKAETSFETTNPAFIITDDNNIF